MMMVARNACIKMSNIYSLIQMKLILFSMQFDSFVLCTTVLSFGVFFIFLFLVRLISDRNIYVIEIEWLGSYTFKLNVHNCKCIKTKCSHSAWSLT